MYTFIQNLDSSTSGLGESRITEAINQGFVINQ